MPRTKKRPDRSCARAAWFEPLTAAQVADRCGFPNREAVQHFWKREKAAGRLPDGARPHFPTYSAPMPSDEWKRDEADADLAPLVEEAPITVTARDPLLARLREVHGNDPRRVIDARASALLQLIEYDIGVPSRARLAAAQAMIDGAMRRAETAQLKQGVHA